MTNTILVTNYLLINYFEKINNNMLLKDTSQE